jgi:hypothetical protein
MKAIKEHGPLVAAGICTVLIGVPFVFAATHAWFWNGERPLAPASVIVVGVLLAALLSRHRWAWWILVVFNGFVVISYLWEWTNVPNFVINVVSFAALVSPPTRRFVARDFVDVSTKAAGEV